MGPLSFDVSSILGWLFDSTIYISILICLILAIKSVMRRKLPPWWSYGLWLLLVFRMLIPWGVESRMSVFNFVPTPPENELYMPFLMEQELNIPILSYDIETPPSTDIDLENNSANERTDNKDSNRSYFNLSLDKVLLIIWFAGVIIFTVVSLFRNLNFWRKVRREAPINDKVVIDVFENCRSSLAIRMNVSIILTDKVKSPALFGYFKPRLLLPPYFLDTLEKDEMRCVFFHELCHLKRHDIGVYWFTTVLQIIHWFNPLVWYAFHHMRVDQEAACDAYVLLKIKQVQPADYANTIVDLLERLVQNRRLPSLAGIIENKSQIRRRIAMIMNYKRYTLKTTLVLFLMLFVVGVVFFTSSSGKADAKKPGTAIDVVVPKGLPESPAMEKVVKVNPTQTTIKKIKNQEEPLLLASNEKKLDSSESKIHKLNEAKPEKDIETSETAQKRQDSAVDYTARGRSYLKKGQIDDAISDLNKAIELNSENAVTYFSRGNAHYMKGQIDKAISDYNEAIEINPRYANAYFSRGYSYQAIGEYGKAISDYNKTISIHPENVYAYDYRGSAYFAQEQHQKAFDDFSKAIELDPGYANAYVNRGKIYHAIRKEYHSAVADYSTAIELNPEDAVTYDYRGGAYLAQEQHQKAFDDFSKAIELDPGYANAYVNRGYIYHAIREEYNSAVADYSKAIELNPEDAVTYYCRGSVYLAQNRNDDALSDYNRTIELNPRYPNAYVSRGVYYHYTRKQYLRAIDDYGEALKLNPEDAVTRRLRRDAYVKIQSMAMGNDITTAPMINVVPTLFDDRNQITNAY